jgi:hypothetical protein
MHVPLVVTPRDRTDYMKAAERGERWTARFGLLFLFIGLGIAAFGLCRTSRPGRRFPNINGGTRWPVSSVA